MAENNIQQWITERRAIHAEATEGPWKAGEVIDWDGIEQSAVTATEGPITWDDHGGDVFMPNDATAIVDAHNILPRALNALNRVLEQIDRMEADANTYGDGGHDLACDALFAYVVTLREAIEGAINGECK